MVVFQAPCPRCIGGKLVRDYDGNSTCFNCSYEYIASVPINQNSTLWQKRVHLPVFDMSKDDED